MLTILLTNWILSGRSGTETHIRDLSLGLKARGHQPMVYTLSWGELAEELTASGVPVVTSLEALPWKPDLVHGHHNFTTISALLALPGTPGLFVCHDFLAWHDEAPKFPRLLLYAAVDISRQERIASELNCSVTEVLCIRNAVDLSRFPNRTHPLPPAPKRALVFGNLATEPSVVAVIREACSLRGVQLDVAGAGAGKPISNPEEILGGYDLVFGQGRCAMESLVTGCAVILCGREGMGPMVTPDNFESLRNDNFGRRCLTETLETQAVLAALDTYSRTDHEAMHQLARTKLGLDEMLDQWLAAYHALLALPCPSDPVEEMRAGAAMLARLSPPLLGIFQAHDQCMARDRETASLKDVIARVKSERDRAKATLHRERERQDSLMRVRGFMATCWKRPWLRPLAQMLGLRSAKDEFHRV